MWDPEGLEELPAICSTPPCSQQKITNVDGKDLKLFPLVNCEFVAEISDPPKEESPNSLNIVEPEGKVESWFTP